GAGQVRSHRRGDDGMFNSQHVTEVRFHEHLPIRIDRPTPDVSTGAPTRCPWGNGKGGRSPVSWRYFVLLGASCGRPELCRGDADESLEVVGELALVREAGVRADLRQGQVASRLQELLGPLDAAGDDVLVRRQAGGSLELSREVVGAEADEQRHLRESGAHIKVLLDVFNDGA